MNKIFLIGRITKELELKKTSTDKSVCDFSIAVNRDKDNTDFINVEVWNIPAENLVKYQTKGSLISVEGQLRNDTYEKQDGTKGYKTYVLANNIEYLESKKAKEEHQEEDPYEEMGEKIEKENDDNFLD